MAIWKPAASGNFQSGRRNPISRITFHHIVGDAPAAIARFQTPGEEVSANYVIGSDGSVYQCIRDSDTAYCDANADSNSRTISIEHAGPPYAEAMYQASIALCSELIRKYGINDFKRHRDVSNTPTACPGELNVERIVNAAKQGGDEMVDDAGARHLLTDYGILVQPGNAPDRQPTKQEVENLIGRTFSDAMAQLRSYQPFKNNLAKIKYYDADLKAAHQAGLNKENVGNYIKDHLS